jgi:hypothetical protein
LALIQAGGAPRSPFSALPPCAPGALSPLRENPDGKALEKRDLVLSQSPIDRAGYSYPYPLADTLTSTLKH